MKITARTVLLSDRPREACGVRFTLAKNFVVQVRVDQKLCSLQELSFWKFVSAAKNAAFCLPPSRAAAGTCSDIEEMVYFRVKVSTPMSLRDRRPAGIVGGRIPLPQKLDGLVSPQEWAKRVDHFNNEAVMVMRNEISCQEAVICGAGLFALCGGACCFYYWQNEMAPKRMTDHLNAIVSGFSDDRLIWGCELVTMRDLAATQYVVFFVRTPEDTLPDPADLDMTNNPFLAMQQMMGGMIA
jgi:hypothetical protein